MVAAPLSRWSNMPLALVGVTFISYRDGRKAELLEMVIIYKPQKG